MTFACLRLALYHEVLDLIMTYFSFTGAWLSSTSLRHLKYVSQAVSVVAVWNSNSERSCLKVLWSMCLICLICLSIFEKIGFLDWNWQRIAKWSLKACLLLRLVSCFTLLKSSFCLPFSAAAWALCCFHIHILLLYYIDCMVGLNWRLY